MAVMQSLLATVMAFAGASRRDEGQTMAEYGLLLAGIAVLAMGAVFALGPVISDLFTNITANLTP